MTNKNPDWYSRLKGNPVHDKTFSDALMDQIEQQAYASEPVRMDSYKHRRRRINRLRASSSAALLLIIVAGIVGIWRHEAYGPSVTALPTTPPKATAVEPTPTPVAQPDEGTPIKKPQRLEGAFKDQLPFQSEQVEAISLYNKETKQTVEVPKERMYVILQNLNYLELQNAQTSGTGTDYGSSNATHLLKFKVGDQAYTLDYNVGTNTYGILNSDLRFYADDLVWMLMQSLLGGQQIWMDIDALMEKARLEAEQQSRSDEGKKVYDSNRLRVGEFDYEGWNKQFVLLSSGIPYYDPYRNQTGRIQTLGQDNEHLDVLHLSGTIIFASNANQTPDGVTVGITEKEVLKLLGEPNKKTATEWGYRMGDYVRFHLYFDQGKVRFMTLTMPV